jgi:hypothetical protein
MIREDHTQFPSYTDETILPPFILPPPLANPQKGKRNVDKLKKDEVIEVRKSLAIYEEQLYFEERLLGLHRNRPRSLYLPKAICDHLVAELLKIKSRADLNIILASLEWPFIESQGSNLFDLVCLLQKDIHSRRKPKPRKQPKPLSATLSSDSEDFEANLPPIAPKRVALAPAENQPRAKRLPQQSLAEAESYYARTVAKSYRATTPEPSDNLRRSGRLRN